MTETAREPRVRLFVALELPSEVRSELSRWASPLLALHRGALRGVADDGLHVTLCFLGGQPAAAVSEILAAAAGAGTLPAAALRVGEGLWLPRRGPRVLAVGLEDSGDRLGAVQASVSEALAAGGWYRPESRPFLPHVTVARVRHGARVRPGSLPAPPSLEFPGVRVTLFRSRLSPAGARYEPLGSVELSA